MCRKTADGGKLRTSTQPWTGLQISTLFVSWRLRTGPWSTDTCEPYHAPFVFQYLPHRPRATPLQFTANSPCLVRIGRAAGVRYAVPMLHEDKFVDHSLTPAKNTQFRFCHPTPKRPQTP